MTDSGWQAHVEPEFITSGVRVHLGRRALGPGDASTIRVWGHANYVTVIAPQWGAAPAEPEEKPDRSTWLRLPGDEARALYEALAEHFGHGAPDTRDLRKDYTDERARVDRLTDALTVIATRPPPAPPILAPPVHVQQSYTEPVQFDFRGGGMPPPAI